MKEQWKAIQGFVYVLKSNEIIALNSYLDGELEIIGNIHEQAEQKDK